MQNKRPKIAFWFRYGPADHSELFHAIPHIVEALATHAEVHYFGMRTATPVPAAIQQHAILHWLPCRVDRTNNRDKLFKTILWILALPGVALWCRCQRMDAVYMDETIPLSPLIARVFFGRNVAVTVADFFTDIYLTGALAFLGRAIRAIDLWTWRRLPLIFTRAKTTRTWLARHGVNPDRVQPVYDPCDLTRYHPLPPDQRQQARQSFGFTPQQVILVHHGILHPNKGNDWILRALAQLRPSAPHLHYLLIGDGPDMPRLRQLIQELQMEDAVTLTGWLPTLDHVNQALNAGDIGLVMRVGAQSDDFHMTGALVHNMACGLPILAARLGGVSEVIEENRNGLLFDPTQPEEFQRKLRLLLDNPALRQTLGAAAHTAATRHFDINRVTQHTTQPLLALLPS